GLDATDAPAEHGKAVDHRRVAIGADEGIGIGDGLAAFGLGPDGLRQVFEVYLVADTRARGDNAEIVEGRLAPAQEFVTLAIALVFAVDVLGKGGGGAEIVDHYGMVDDEVDRHQRIDLLRIGLELFGCIAHGGEVDNGGDAGKSCISTRAGRKAISCSALPLSWSQAATALISSG